MGGWRGVIELWIALGWAREEAELELKKARRAWDF